MGFCVLWNLITLLIQLTKLPIPLHAVHICPSSLILNNSVHLWIWRSMSSIITTRKCKLLGWIYKGSQLSMYKGLGRTKESLTFV